MIIYYNIMSIKSPQTLIAESLKTVKTISPEEALEMSNENKCNLIDIRDEPELEKQGRIEKAFHISRGLLEFSIHPDSSFVLNNKIDLDKELDILESRGKEKVAVVEMLDEKQIYQLEPLIKSSGGLLVPSTGVIDQNSLMQSYLGEFESNGGMVSYNSKVKKITILNNGFEIIGGILNGPILLPMMIAGVGVPQLTAVLDAFELAQKNNIPVSYTHLTLPTKRIV